MNGSARPGTVGIFIEGEARGGWEASRVSERMSRQESKKKMFTLAHIPHIGLDGILNGLRTPNKAFFLLKSQTFGLGETNWAGKV